VLDFGIARAARSNRGGRFDAGGLGALTPAYASCEMIENAPPDNRDDVYGLGCVIYELLSGKHPFDRKDAVTARDNSAQYLPISVLSKAQNRALAGALEFDRARRTASIETLLEALRRGAHPTSRYRVWIAVAAAVVVAIGGAVWVAASRMGSHDTEAQIIESLIQPTAKTPDNFDPSMVAMLLDQGREYLAEGKKQFDPAVLSEGVSTANGAFRSVLRLDPANRDAAIGIAEIFKLYRGEAKRYYDEKQYRKALELADIGLRIYPASEDLRRLRSELAGRLAEPTGPSAAP
jgi:serine/threonine protein kinase